MAKVLAMEVGASLIRFSEVDYKVKNPKVYSKFTVVTPEDVVKEDAIAVNGELVHVLKDALMKHHIHTKQLVIVLNSTKIASKEVMIPFVKENRVGDVIRTNASDFFPVDLQLYELGHVVTNTVENNNKKQLKVLVYAVPKTLIDSYKELASVLGCTITAFDYSGNSVYQMVRTKDAEGTQMVIKLDETTSNVTIINNQVIALQRTVAYGVNDIIEMVRKSEECKTGNYKEALKLLYSKDYISKDAPAPAKDDLEFMDLDKEESKTDSTVQDDIRKSLQSMVNAILRVTDFYISRGGGAGIDKAYVTGLGGDFMGIDQFMTNAITIPTQQLTEIPNFNLAQDFKGEYAGRYLTCLGATIAPVGFMNAQESKKGNEKKKKSDDSVMRVSMIVFIGCIILAVVLIVFSVVKLSMANKKLKDMNARIEELQPTKQIYLDYLQQKYTSDKLNFLYNATNTPNEQLVAFIEEMEEKMPESLNVQAFSSSVEGVEMTLTVKDKKAAAKLIQQFRTFESISIVTVDSINDLGAVKGTEVQEQEPMVAFTISLSYKMDQPQEDTSVENSDTTETEEQSTEESVEE